MRKKKSSEIENWGIHLLEKNIEICMPGKKRKLYVKLISFCIKRCLKTFVDIAMFKSMIPAVPISLVEGALLVKLFYKNKGNASAAFRKYRRGKNQLRRPLCTIDIWILINRFEETSNLGVQPGKDRK
ncbi:hypothetical protein TNCV_3725141 [Trichonephila clavipes]|nr:hypothetical protein TNCV_3725141 [Trichonephila clavipes]